MQANRYSHCPWLILYGSFYYGQLLYILYSTLRLHWQLITLTRPARKIGRGEKRRDIIIIYYQVFELRLWLPHEAPV